MRFDTAESPVLFIADLHLDTDRPAATRAFLRFLETTAAEAAALFILGDLFEAWVGDDARPSDDPVAPALATLSARGTPVYLMHGNRDFLIGTDFCRAAQAQLLAEPTVVAIDGEAVLLEHGDALCTDDVAYQAFRRQVRDQDWQRTFLAQPVDRRIEQARDLRRRSGEAMAGKTARIMDVNADTVDQRLRDWGVRHLIHGHTHRPAIHQLTVDDHPGTRVVLGDWFEQGSVLRIDNGVSTLETLGFDG
ncbi:UDP-2,3-diacylglucosamine diphosphatase [Spiribacter vilamensis]|uniref:UDP-2,3-diacylglucosamine hydrolase n=1 Tax=Spiribacter vilamensis TaxID=531306 RepID=A0A4Q8CYD9_9GAMM|nr:UDP-2,3-diacylglucosamine diphosphatase [Spiribacter vilamensis]RZU97999.1 UDP-2,3-diacylglucosamine hydrolase [Spiribacter vilamensis]